MRLEDLLNKVNGEVDAAVVEQEVTEKVASVQTPEADEDKLAYGRVMARGFIETLEKIASCGSCEGIYQHSSSPADNEGEMPEKKQPQVASKAINKNEKAYSDDVIGANNHIVNRAVSKNSQNEITSKVASKLYEKIKIAMDVKNESSDEIEEKQTSRVDTNVEENAKKNPKAVASEAIDKSDKTFPPKETLKEDIIKAKLKKKMQESAK